MKKKLSTKSVHSRAYRRRDLQRKQEATALQATHRQRTGVMIVVFVLALLGVAAAAMIVGGAA